MTSALQYPNLNGLQLVIIQHRNKNYRLIFQKNHLKIKKEKWRMRSFSH